MITYSPICFIRATIGVKLSRAKPLLPKSRTTPAFVPHLISRPLTSPSAGSAHPFPSSKAKTSLRRVYSASYSRHASFGSSSCVALRLQVMLLMLLLLLLLLQLPLLLLNILLLWLLLLFLLFIQPSILLLLPMLPSLQQTPLPCLHLTPTPLHSEQRARIPCL
jgi:hypothetical protein